jgi:glyoxylase-like metal-dependent hydrolase (beta-lactamase superfamily II)
MQDDSTTLRIGEARVTILNAGDMHVQLSEEMAVPESEWRPRYADLFERPRLFPSLSIYVELSGVKLLVDINDYLTTVLPDSEYAIAGYTPPPPLPARLASLGVQRKDLTHLVITHAHWDHFAGTTSPTGTGEYEPTFAQACHYLGAADWRASELQTALTDATSLEARTLGVLHERGILHLVERQEQIAPGIDILPAPGETKGHQVVRVHSAGETLYIVGDLFHDAIEVEHPDWMVIWADPESMLATRHWLMEQALVDHALLVAAHIPGAGRLTREGDKVAWSDVR